MSVISVTNNFSLTIFIRDFLRFLFVLLENLFWPLKIGRLDKNGSSDRNYVMNDNCDAFDV